MKMSKRYAIFITCLFLAFIGSFFVANAVTPDREFSPMENRNLAQLPTLEVGTVAVGPEGLTTTGNLFNGAFMEDFESYVTDQFVLRDQWIALKARAEAAMGKQENNGVYLGSRDTLFARFQVPTTAVGQRRIDQNFGYLDKLTEVTDVPVYFSLIPGKVTVWADRLPQGAPNDDEGVFLARGAAAKAQWIDLLPALTAHAGEDIFFRTDHHWSSLGAYYAYQALMEGMGLTPVPLSRFTPDTVSEAFLGTTFSSSGVRWVAPDYIDYYVPEDAAEADIWDNDTDHVVMGLYDRSMLAEKDKYASFLAGNKPLKVLRSNVAPQGAPKIVVVRDSFSDALAPFLCYNFSEVHLLDPRYNKTSIAQYVKDNAIDQVLVIYSVENFISDGNLFVLGRAAK